MRVSLGFFGQVNVWPFHLVKDVMQWAVSWNVSWDFPDFVSTNYVSGESPEFVKKMQSGTNQQVTNVLYVLVGTPEAVCPPTNYGSKKLTEQQKHLKWCQWLAGFIDGDGCFLVSKTNHSSLEITVHSKDELILAKIKQTYGGSIKPRAGLNAVRYRLHHKQGVLALVNDVNGNIRHPARFIQLEKVCQCLDLQPKQAAPLHAKHGWFAGMFDSDGSVYLNPKSHQITLSVTSKHKPLMERFHQVFAGSLYFDKSQNGYWTWAVQGRSNVHLMIEYFKHFPVFSSRRQKLFLVPEIYKLLEQKAPSLPKETALYKKWFLVLEKWSSLSRSHLFL